MSEFSDAAYAHAAHSRGGGLFSAALGLGAVAVVAAGGAISSARVRFDGGVAGLYCFLFDRLCFAGIDLAAAGEDAADDAGLRLGKSGLLFVIVRDLRRLYVVSHAAHAAAHGGAFFQRAQGGPQGVFHAMALRFDEGLGGEAMPDMAAIAEDIVLCELPKRAAAIGARERRRRSAHLTGFERIGSDLGDVAVAEGIGCRVGRRAGGGRSGGFQFGARHERASLRLREGLACKMCEERPDLLGRMNVVYIDVLQAAGRHAGEGSILRILDDGDSAVALDLEKAERAVIESPGEDDADDGGA